MDKKGIKLFLDWFSTLNENNKIKVKILLNTNKYTSFNKLIEMMGIDGQTFSKYITEDKKTILSQLNEELQDYLLNNKFDYNYFPLQDRSKSMRQVYYSNKEGLISAIKNALLVGDLNIARVLLSKLPYKQLVTEIIPFVNNLIMNYNRYIDNNNNYLKIIYIKQDTYINPKAPNVVDSSYIDYIIDTITQIRAVKDNNFKTIS